MDSSDYLDAIGDGLDECLSLAGTEFTVSGKEIDADFSGAEQSVELTTTGGKVVKLRGMLVISRRELNVQPADESIVIGPDGTRYRVHDVQSDAASWTLTLTSPKGR